MVVTIGTGLGFTSTASALAIMMVPMLDPSEFEPSFAPPSAIVSEVPVETPDLDEGAIPAPEITLVRVDELGSAVIGGIAEPNTALRAVFGEDVILATRSEDSGDFVMLADLPATEDARELIVISYNDDGTERARSNPVLVLGRTADEAPRVVIASDEGTQLVVPATNSSTSEQVALATDNPPLPAELSLDTITYDTEGDVTVGGRASVARSVRVYLDNQPLATEAVGPAGGWQINLPKVDTGLYTLRIDEVNAEGDVTSRVESPFKKEIPDPVSGQITVQPGNTLWALAANEFGNGDRYVMIFDANKELIKDPNLIYPGQVFILPDQ